MRLAPDGGECGVRHLLAICKTFVSYTVPQEACDQQCRTIITGSALWLNALLTTPTADCSQLLRCHDRKTIADWLLPVTATFHVNRIGKPLDRVTIAG